MERRELTGVPGVRWVPAQASGVGALVLAGSSGRVDSARAELLARHGVVAESVQWFGGSGQNSGPWEIPLELFLDRVEQLASVCERVLVLGTSFGSEAALLTGAFSPQVSAVVAFAPSDVVWTGVTADGRATSHWTFQGAALPCVPFIEDWHPASDPPEFLDFYRRCRESFPGQLAQAAIPVERIPQVAVVAGGDDRVWPSVTQAEAIAERRSRHGLATTVIQDAEAGHRVLLPDEPPVTGGVRMVRGGTDRADRRLGQKAWEHLLTLV